MKSAVETLAPTKVRLTVQVTPDELKPSIDQAYARLAEQMTVPGFRKGKVPPRIIDQRVGRVAVMEQAVNEGLPGFYAQAVRDNDLRPLAQPQVEVLSVPGLPGRDPDTPDELRFTAEVVVRPVLELPDLGSLKVEVDGTEPTDEEVATRLDALRERFGTLVGVDRPAADGDFVQLDLVAKIDDADVDQVSGVSYQLGSGSMLEGMDEALSGLSAEESTTFETTLVGGAHAGEKALVTLTATAIKERQLPEADDEFAELASEFDTMDELTESLRAQVAEAKVGDQAIQARDRLLETLLETVEIPVPTELVEEEVSHHLAGEERDEDDEHRAEVTEESTTSLRRQILLDTLAETLEVKVGQDELLEYLLGTARQYGMDPNEFISTLSGRGQIPAVVAEVARGKSLATALRQVTVVGPDGAVVDLTAYIGSDETDAPADGVDQEAGADLEDAPVAGSASDISSVVGR
ncbi:MAG: trigger factor [Micrococcales bacterium]|nr:trigger factor [Micrococcales bacterium]